MIKLGDTVTWFSGSNGTYIEKEGVVVDVVKPVKRPDFRCPSMKWRGTPRPHESYIVAVKTGKSIKHYWPIVSGLRVGIMRDSNRIINAPWVIEAPIAEEHLQIRDSTGRRIAVIAGTYPASQETESQHAHLMCAAPELYDALQKLLYEVSNDVDVYNQFCDVQEAAIKALAKARGES